MKTTLKRKKLSLKPWITKGIYNSIKTKNRLFRICYKHGDITKIVFYKTYCNKLTHLKRTFKIQSYNKLYGTIRNFGQPCSPKKNYDRLETHSLIKICYLNSRSTAVFVKLWVATPNGVA